MFLPSFVFPVPDLLLLYGFQSAAACKVPGRSAVSPGQGSSPAVSTIPDLPILLQAEADYGDEASCEDGCGSWLRSSPTAGDMRPVHAVHAQAVAAPILREQYLQ